MMDNTPIYGCSGCATTGGRMGCATHGPIAVLVSPAPAPQFFVDVQTAVLAERERCRKIAADHPWKCQGEICDCARKIAYDIMNGPEGT